MQNFGVQVSSTAEGYTPSAFLCVVEHVTPDGEIGYEIVTSSGATDTRIDRLRAVLTRPTFDRIAGGENNTQAPTEP